MHLFAMKISAQCKSLPAHPAVLTTGNVATRRATLSPEKDFRGAILQVMSAELIGILAVGVSLAGLVLTVGGMAIAAIRALTTRLEGLEARMGALEQRQARLEGLIEGSGLFRSLAVVAEAPNPSSGD